MPPAPRAAFLALVAVCGCASSPAAGPGVHVAHRPPDRTDILEAVIRSEAASLAGDPDCAWPSDAEERTVGRYIGGLFAGGYGGGNVDAGANWIEIATAPGARADVAVWRSQVIVHVGEPKARGLEFLIRQSDGLVLADSFRCIRAP